MTDNIINSIVVKYCNDFFIICNDVSITIEIKGKLDIEKTNKMYEEISLHVSHKKIYISFIKTNF